MSDRTVYRSGPLCGEKIQYPDGVGYTVGYPVGEAEDEFWFAWDFSGGDIDSLIELLHTLKAAPAEAMEADTEE